MGPDCTPGAAQVHMSRFVRPLGQVLKDMADKGEDPSSLDPHAMLKGKKQSQYKHSLSSLTNAPSAFIACASAVSVVERIGIGISPETALIMGPECTDQAVSSFIRKKIRPLGEKLSNLAHKGIDPNDHPVSFDAGAGKCCYTISLCQNQHCMHSARCSNIPVCALF